MSILFLLIDIKKGKHLQGIIYPIEAHGRFGRPKQYLSNCSTQSVRDENIDNGKTSQSKEEGDQSPTNILKQAKDLKEEEILDLILDLMIYLAVK